MRALVTTAREWCLGDQPALDDVECKGPVAKLERGDVVWGGALGTPEAPLEIMEGGSFGSMGLLTKSVLYGLGYQGNVDDMVYVFAFILNVK